jgi:hypothetical protein
LNYPDEVDVRVNIREEIYNLLIDSVTTLAKSSADGLKTKPFGKILRAISDLQEKKGEIYRFACQLDSSQAEQMNVLLESYRESLNQVLTFNEEEQYDFFVGLPHDIGCDMSRLIKDYDIQKKKQKATLSVPSRLKVTEESPFLFAALTN